MAKEELFQLLSRRELRQRLWTVVQLPLVERPPQGRRAERAENAGTLRYTRQKVALDDGQSAGLDVRDGIVVSLHLRRWRVVEIVAALLQ